MPTLLKPTKNGDDLLSQLRLAMTPVADDGISKNELDISIKLRGNNLPWKGQFSPQLIEALLKRYANKKDVVFDPFGGSGTVVSESICLGLSALTTEINPAAYLLCRLYELCTLSSDQRAGLIAAFDSWIDKVACSAFGKEHAQGILTRSLFQAKEDGEGADFIKIRNALAILVDLDVNGRVTKDIGGTWRRLRSVLLSLVTSDKEIKVFNADARSTPLINESIDLVITSPPYINVFNYHQQYRLSTEKLGWKPLTAARAEIGSNRKNRQNRFLTVIQYCLDMSQVFAELARVSKLEAQVIFVVGRESRVRGIAFYNSGLVAQLAAASANFNVEQRAERVFTNRFGEKIYEDILYFRKRSSNKLISHPFEEARLIAANALREAYDRSEGDVRGDLDSALTSIADVQSSPTFVTESRAGINGM